VVCEGRWEQGSRGVAQRGGLDSMAEAAAFTDPLLHEADCPEGWKPDGEDSEGVAKLKSVIVTPAGDGLQETLKVRAMDLRDGIRR
jgi:hypothetical protein